MGKNARVIAISVCLCLGAISAQGQPPQPAPDVAAMCKEMGLALGKCIVDGKTEEGAKCDQLIDTLLGRQDLTAKQLQQVAQVARLRNQPQKAITAVERVLTQCPDAEFSFMSTPGRLIGQFWIASIARQSGDLVRARNAYEAVMQDVFTLGADEDNKGFKILVSLLQADCLVALGDIEKARDILHSMPSVQRQPDTTPFEWGTYYLANLEKRGEVARHSLQRTPFLRGSWYTAASILVGNGVTRSPMSLSYGDDVYDHEVYLYSLKQAADSKPSGIEGEAARYALGTAHLDKNNDLAKAKGYFESLYKSDSFFGPEAGLRLLECEKKEQKPGQAPVDTAALVQELKTRFPGYAPAIDEVDKAPVPTK